MQVATFLATFLPLWESREVLITVVMSLISCKRADPKVSLLLHTQQSWLYRFTLPIPLELLLHPYSRSSGGTVLCARKKVIDLHVGMMTWKEIFRLCMLEGCMAQLCTIMQVDGCNWETQECGWWMALDKHFWVCLYRTWRSLASSQASQACHVCRVETPSSPLTKRFTTPRRRTLSWAPPRLLSQSSPDLAPPASCAAMSANRDR